MVEETFFCFSFRISKNPKEKEDSSQNENRIFFFYYITLFGKLIILKRIDSGFLKRTSSLEEETRFPEGSFFARPDHSDLAK